MDEKELLQMIRKAAEDKIKKFYLGHAKLTALPPEFGQLTNLEWLYLSYNQLTTLPPGITQLTNLRELYLSHNQLTTLPPEIAQLTNLQVLNLFGNHLATLPPEVAQLTNLLFLYLEHNQLTALPPEIGQLTNLRKLDLEGNPLTSPPPEIVAQGTEAVLAYLREVFERSNRQWVSKLLVVGQGGVGKTCLLCALRGEPFSDQPTTHGVDIRSLELPHPKWKDIMMQLNSWDFGGQEIYHATHQFFLTNRSLFLLVWNARHGFEQGKLYYWLDTIQALAPDSPVLLVAAQIDERDADLPLAELRQKYPQIAGHYEVSNKTGAGIDRLRDAIAAAAARLPLMGEIWPLTWLNAAQTIRALPEKHVTPQQLYDVMAQQGMDVQSAGVLAQWLHDLGDILFFRDHEELNDVVILKPQWVTEYVSKVLESEEVIARNGVFSRQQMDALWHDLDPGMGDHFLRLMERFDLSYRTLEDRDISLVVERLPRDQPPFEAMWNAPKASGDCNEVTMKFELSTVPAGIPTWFIARSHRFTTGIHWRTGAVFAYESEERKHLSLAQTFPHHRYLQLTVRGPNPANFFALMKDGIEVTLSRFPGLQVRRLIPCPCGGGEPCSHEFEYEDLLKRVRKRPTIECPKSFKDVPVTHLLFGLHWSAQDVVLSRLDELETRGAERHEEVIDAIDNLRTLAQREFLNAFRREQERIESYCPNVFVLRPRATSGLRRLFVGQKMELQLFCQAPGCWHPTDKTKGGVYEIDDPAKWMKVTAPYLRRLVSVLKYATPLIGPWLGQVGPDFAKEFDSDIKLMESLVTKLPDLQDDPNLTLTEKVGVHGDPERAEGAALRALRELLDSKDPARQWGGLRRVVTPEGHYLWLCEYHAAEYRR